MWVEHIAAGVHHPRICWLFGDKMKPAILGFDHPEGYGVAVLSNANARNVISLQMESQHVRDIQVRDQIAIHYNQWVLGQFRKKSQAAPRSQRPILAQIFNRTAVSGAIPKKSFNHFPEIINRKEDSANTITHEVQH